VFDIIRLHEQHIVQEDLKAAGVSDTSETNASRSGVIITITSTFLLKLQPEWALTIFLTVARGYSFCPGAMPESAALRVLRECNGKTD